MRTRLIILVGAAVLALGACGSYGSDSGSGSSSDGSSAGSGAGAATAAAVSEADTDIGAVLVDADGLTLYGLTDDADGVSTCVDACAEAWPPLTVDDAELPAGLDPGLFSVIERPDGTFQLQAGSWPLYRFAGDTAPGDVNGQGSGGIWFAAAPDGSLVRGEGTAPAAGADGGY